MNFDIKFMNKTIYLNIIIIIIIIIIIKIKGLFGFDKKGKLIFNIYHIISY